MSSIETFNSTQHSTNYILHGEWKPGYMLSPIEHSIHTTIFSVGDSEWKTVVTNRFLRIFYSVWFSKYFLLNHIRVTVYEYIKCFTVQLMVRWKFWRYKSAYHKKWSLYNTYVYNCQSGTLIDIDFLFFWLLLIRDLFFAATSGGTAGRLVTYTYNMVMGQSLPVLTQRNTYTKVHNLLKNTYI